MKLVKRKTIYLILALAFFSSLAIKAQQDSDLYSVYYNSIEPVDIQLSKFPYGLIQWQESVNQGSSWTNIPDANQFTLSYSTANPVYLRALVLSGTCDSIYSQYISLETLRIYTSGVDGISDSSAVIHCEIDTMKTCVRIFVEAS